MRKTPRASKPVPSKGFRGWWLRRSRAFRLIASAGILGAVGLIVVFVIVYVATRIPLPNQINTDQATIVSYSDGHELVRIGAVNRTDVNIGQVPKEVQQAVLAAEDRRYYSEPGISIPGIVRALWVDLTGGSIRQGGSTITQQYAKNAYLTQARTFTRKIREVAIAIKLDRKYSKDQVLQWYLNTIYFGRGAYGIEAASQTYFGVHVSKLSVEQGAVLAGLIRAPSGLDPGKHPKAARARWQQVLKAMVSAGWLPQARAAHALYPAIRPLGAGGIGGSGVRSDIAYLREQVQAELIADGISENRINLGGLRVSTTVNRQAQIAAEQAVESVTKGTPVTLQEGLIAIQPGTGAIMASYGGKTFGRTATTTDFLDNVFTAERQPGSSFKPIVLATALMNGIPLTKTYDGSSPKVIPGTTYTSANPLHNFKVNGVDEQYGSIDLATALAYSVNTVYVPLAIDAGLKHVADTAHTMGIPSSGPHQVVLGETPALALGVSTLRPVDMGAVYATFAARGEEATPYLINQVTDNHGHVLYQHSSDQSRAIPPAIADQATFAMQQVIKFGTGTGAALNGRPAAGKTGTTSDNTSAWFCGFTPQLAGVVSMFYANNQPLRGIAGFGQVTGGSLPAIIWKKFMDAALLNQPVVDFAPMANTGPVATATPSAAPTPSGQATPTPSPTPVPTLPPVSPSPPMVSLPPSTTPSPSPSPSPHGASPTP